MLWFVGTISILGFFTVILETQPVDAYRDSLGRLTFILLMVTTLCFLKIVLYPKNKVSSTAPPDPKIIIRKNGLLYWVIISIPITLILLSVAGYYYAAVHIGLRIMASTWGVLLAFVLHDWGLRYFYIQERKIALEQALEKRKAASQPSDATLTPDEAPFPSVDDPDVDLSVVKEQPRRLLRSVVGILLLIVLWMIWSGVLPALNFLNTFVVWDHQVMVDEVLISKETTLLNLMQFLIVGLLTIVAARNIPGVLEIAILQNLPIESGSRYAITTICQYVIVSAGVVFALSFFGIDWGQFGWILAALSVGLGFGLQEIVANFVCGILLFLERPIRVGDIVTVSDVSGMVSRIQIRATTIMNWDRQEFIVPNKEFVTGRILNWTLTNTVNRITVTVGIAYGTDTNKAKEILLDIANQHPEVLNDPLPMVIFEQFGDSSLNLLLRCYLPNLEKRLATIHDLNTVIHQRFNEAGIEIPFPQRDIHIRSTISKAGQGEAPEPKLD
jgi:potassium efflux system protein